MRRVFLYIKESLSFYNEKLEFLRRTYHVSAKALEHLNYRGPTVKGVKKCDVQLATVYMFNM